MTSTPHRPRLAPRLATLVTALAVLSACGSSSASDAPQSSASTGESSGASTESDGVPCTYSPGGQAAAQADLPPDVAVQSGSVPMTIETSVGTVEVTLDADNAPCTVNSFVSLADQGYYDSTPCHRLTASRGLSVLQCGDPSGTGGGGPGYTFGDELNGDETYPAGTLAMANAGPDTNGSQFFIVYGDSALPPAYTVFGTVSTAGLKVVEEVARAGVDGGGSDGPPAQPVTITGVSLS